MVSDVGHFKEIRVEAAGLQGILEEWFVGRRGAGRNDNTIEPMFFDHLFDLVLGILRTGK